MRNQDVDLAAQLLLGDLRRRINQYWHRNGARLHFWQRSRDPLPRKDQLLLARAEWILAFLCERMKDGDREDEGWRRG